ncbi:MAG TPA: hypothetical protein VKY85_02355 [Candidatus Angelobacter sp.]|nr:hypothetical protein [Candidatus Angelobacter sp.]
MTEVAIQQANDAYSKQISAQVARITGELNRLEQLLSAGMVDRRVVAEFRDAVDRVRKTSGHVQSWMDGNLQDLYATLIEERIYTASHLANHLAYDLQGRQEEFSGATALKESLHKLDCVLSADSK